MRIGIGLSAWLRILDFRGRSTRTDVFCFVVVTMLLGIIVQIVLSIAGVPNLDDVLRESVPDLVQRAQLVSASSFVPFAPVFALVARRLHDIGLPSWPGPLLVLAAVLLSGWNDLHFRTGEVIGPLSGGAQLLRAVCVIAMYAALILPPQRQTNRYGPDPRSSREPAPAAGPA